MQQRSRFFYTSMSFGHSRHAEPNREQKSKLELKLLQPTGFQCMKKRLPLCHKLTCSIGCCCWSTRSCQWLGADALFLLSWSCDCWCYSFKIKAPRAPSIFCFPFFNVTISLHASSGSVSLTVFLLGTFPRSARFLSQPPVATHPSWSPCWRLRIFIVTGEVLKGDCAAFSVTFKAIACMMGAAEKWPTASSWQSSTSQVKKKKTNNCCSCSSINWNSVNCSSRAEAAQLLLSLHRLSLCPVVVPRGRQLCVVTVQPARGEGKKHRVRKDSCNHSEGPVRPRTESNSLPPHCVTSAASLCTMAKLVQELLVLRGTIETAQVVFSTDGSEQSRRPLSSETREYHHEDGKRNSLSFISWLNWHVRVFLHNQDRLHCSCHTHWSVSHITRNPPLKTKQKQTTTASETKNHINEKSQSYTWRAF